MESIMPEIKAVNPRQCLADRVKRGVAFIAVLKSVGSETEPCLSTHIKEPSNQPELEFEK
jgi:hypothetical protein